MNVREMHSRKPQLYRTRISNEFREAKRMILVTSDVSARGMNYPDVTLVIQVLLNIGNIQSLCCKMCMYQLLHYPNILLFLRSENISRIF